MVLQSFSFLIVPKSSFSSSFSFNLAPQDSPGAFFCSIGMLSLEAFQEGPREEEARGWATEWEGKGGGVSSGARRSAEGGEGGCAEIQTCYRYARPGCLLHLIWVLRLCRTPRIGRFVGGNRGVKPYPVPYISNPPPVDVAKTEQQFAVYRV